MATLSPEVLASIAQKKLNIQNQKDTGLQQLGSQYNTNLQNLKDYSADTGRRIDDQFAGRGMFNSSLRVDEQGRLQKNIGQRQGYLGQQYAQAQSGIQNQYQNALDALNDYQNQAMADATRNELQQQQIAAQNAAAAAQQQYGVQQAAAPQAPAPAAAPADQPSLDALKTWYTALLMQNPFNTDVRNALQFMGYDPNVLYDEQKQKDSGNYLAAVSTGGSKAY